MTALNPELIQSVMPIGALIGFISFGLIGGITFIFIIILSLKKAYLAYKKNGGKVFLIILAILIAEIGSWHVGGQYAGSALIWFLIGSVNSLFSDETKKENIDTDAVVGSTWRSRKSSG